MSVEKFSSTRVYNKIKYKQFSSSLMTKLTFKRQEHFGGIISKAPNLCIFIFQNNVPVIEVHKNYDQIAWLNIC